MQFFLALCRRGQSVTSGRTEQYQALHLVRMARGEGRCHQCTERMPDQDAGADAQGIEQLFQCIGIVAGQWFCHRQCCRYAIARRIPGQHQSLAAKVL